MSRSNDPKGPATSWRRRPVVARLIRFVLWLIPLVAGLVACSIVRHIVHPVFTSFLVRVLWLVEMFLLATAVTGVVRRLVERFLPLSTLCMVNLAFPEVAPSRMKLALRIGNSRTTDLVEDFRNAKLTGSVQEAAEQVLALVEALNRHDRRTRGHSEKVRAFAEMIAEELELNETDRNLLRWGAMLHDIGKLVVPAAILNKPGKPDDDEWRQIKAHPGAAVERLGPLRPWLGDWALAASEHHERFDGTGYPLGLKGSEISFAGRIVAVADAFEVMTAVRSYKKPMSYEAARAELVRCAGTHFDPEVVRALVRVGVTRRNVSSGIFGSLADLIARNPTASAAVGGAARTAVGPLGSLATPLLVVPGMLFGSVVQPNAFAAAATPDRPPAALAMADVPDLPTHEALVRALGPADPTKRPTRPNPSHRAKPSASPADGTIDANGDAPSTEPAVVDTSPSADAAAVAPEAPALATPVAAEEPTTAPPATTAPSGATDEPSPVITAAPVRPPATSSVTSPVAATPTTRASKPTTTLARTTLPTTTIPSTTRPTTTLAATTTVPTTTVPITTTTVPDGPILDITPTVPVATTTTAPVLTLTPTIPLTTTASTTTAPTTTTPTTAAPTTTKPTTTTTLAPTTTTTTPAPNPTPPVTTTTLAPATTTTAAPTTTTTATTTTTTTTTTSTTTTAAPTTTTTTQPPTGCAVGTWATAYYNAPTGGANTWTPVPTGTPLIDTECRTFFWYWLLGFPPANGVPTSFSLRTVRDLQLSTGDAIIDLRHADGVRLYVDGVLRHEQWTRHGVGTASVPVHTTAGWHRLTVEYFDVSTVGAFGINVRDGVAPVTSGWPALDCTGNGRWAADYYDPPDYNVLELSYADISGVVTDNDCVDAPALVSVAAGARPKSNAGDSFAATFQKDVTFAGGMTRFALMTASDDGVRVLIDGVRVDDDWSDNSGERIFTTYITPGVHRVRFEHRDSFGPGGLTISWTP